MFSIRQALYFAARVAYSQYCNEYHRCIAFTCKPNNFIPILRHERFLHEGSGDGKQLGKLEGKMRLIFTCKKCKTRNSKLISKLAYNKGVIIVRCDGCKNNHLIADNLGWFSEKQKKINIEKLMASRNEIVRKVINDLDGYYEAITNEEYHLQQQSIGKTKESVSTKNHHEEIDELEVSNKR